MPLLVTPDYDQAIAEFVRQAVDGLMSEADPIYASLRRVPLPEGVGTIRVEAGDARTTSPQVHMTQEVQIQRSDVIEGNLEQFHDVLGQIGESYLQQFMRPLFEHVGDAAEAVGNSITLQGATLGWDDLLDASDRTEWAVDATGHVRPPQVVAGAAVVARLREIPLPTVEQQQRAAAMVTRKQEEHVSRRRRRRLR